jgi:methylmalonyl-CoA/ethylmalonyl-CoA epimerase
MIYRHCYSTKDIEKAYDELMDAGVQPQDENGAPLPRANLQSDRRTHYLVTKALRAFSIEILEKGAGSVYPDCVYLKNSGHSWIR